MSSVNSLGDCLERARLHDQLANATEDGPARMMHQAMASEFRRRAAEIEANGMPQIQSRGPVLEMHVANG